MRLLAGILMLCLLLSVFAGGHLYLAHRLVLKEGMEFSVDKEDLLEKIVQDMEVPPWK